MDHHFHPAAVITKSHEDSTANNLVDYMLSRALQELLNFDYCPSAFMTDHSWAFTNSNIFLCDSYHARDMEAAMKERKWHGLCHFHFTAALDKNGKVKLHDKSHLAELKSDFYKLNSLSCNTI